jgi:hypothetical protein
MAVSKQEVSSIREQSRQKELAQTLTAEERGQIKALEAAIDKELLDLNTKVVFPNFVSKDGVGTDSRAVIAQLAKRYTDNGWVVLVNPLQYNWEFAFS